MHENTILHNNNVKNITLKRFILVVKFKQRIDTLSIKDSKALCEFALYSISDKRGESIQLKYTGVIWSQSTASEPMLVLGKGHQAMLLLKLQILEENMAILGWVTFVLITLSRIHKYGHMRRDFCIHIFPEQNSTFGITVSCFLFDKWRPQDTSVEIPWFYMVLIVNENTALPSFQPQVDLKGNGPTYQSGYILTCSLLTTLYCVLLFIRKRHLKVNNNII